MTFFQAYLAGFGAIMAMMVSLWIVSVRIRNSSIVDIFWGVGFVLAALLYFVLGRGYPLRKILVLILVAIWGLRLSLHIFIRNRGHGEDFRYQRWREHAGGRYWWTSFFRVFLLQGILMWFISMPLLAAQFHTEPAALTLFDIVGLVVWGFGFFFEAVGDWQLMRFKRDPNNAGKLLDTGLWAWTRHPNYFGDAAVWWGLFLFAIPTPAGLLTFYAPALMSILLLRVSGVAMLEKSLKKSKPGEYVRNTPAFFPRPPRKRPN